MRLPHYVGCAVLVVMAVSGCGERREDVFDSRTGKTVNCVVKPDPDNPGLVKLSKCYPVE
jgi:hypothetical protein